MSHANEEMHDTNKRPCPRREDDTEMAALRQENAVLKQLVQRALLKKLKWVDVPPSIKDNDQSFFLTAIRADAISWYDLPPKWKDNIEVTCAAFELEPVASARRIYPDGHPRHVQWEDLPYHLMTSEKVIIAALGSRKGPHHLSQIPFKSRSNPDIISVAFQHQRISFDDIPVLLRYDHPKIALLCVQRELISADDCTCFDNNFLRLVIENGELEWAQLPAIRRHDPDFARSLTSATSYASLNDALANIPALRNDASFWRRLLSWSMSPNGRLHTNGFKSLFSAFRTADLCANGEFMFEMCCGNAHVFPLVDDSLKNNADFWQSALARNVGILQYLHHESQLLYPDLVQGCIPKLVNQPRYNIVGAIEPSFWHQHSFVLEWLNTGLGIPANGQGISRELITSWFSNRNLALAYAMHMGQRSNDWISQEFLVDVDFMMQVVESNPYFYFHAIGKAKSDPWVLITALGSLDFARKYLLNLRINGQEDEIHNAILGFIRGQLSTFETFSRCILGNMLSTQSIANTGSNLTLLNQGPETCLVFKKTLAAYLGISTGKSLSRLRRAEDNVNDAIAAWLPTYRESVSIEKSI